MSWGLIKEMGHVSIGTPDVDSAIKDATELLGLTLSEKSGDAAYLTAAPKHHELVYVHSDVDGIYSIGLVARDSGALKEIRARVERENFRMVSEKPFSDAVEEGFSFVGPEGWVFEVYTGMPPFSPSARGGGISVSSGFGPDRYGHLNFHPCDVKGMMEFLRRIFDFRLSDVIGDDFAYFMRCNSDHHGIALIKGAGTFHHHAWQTESVQDLTSLGDRLHLVGRELIWGPVRHGAGHNIAAYYVESTGAVVELYTDLEQIYDNERNPVVWGSGENWYNMWNSYRPEDFRNFGIPALAPRV